MKEIGTQNINGLSMPKGYETPFHMPKENMKFYDQMKKWQASNGYTRTNYKEPYNYQYQETSMNKGWE